MATWNRRRPRTVNSDRKIPLRAIAPGPAPIFTSGPPASSSNQLSPGYNSCGGDDHDRQSRQLPLPRPPSKVLFDGTATLAPSRSLGVHHMLNKSSEDPREPRGVRRPASKMDVWQCDTRFLLPPIYCATQSRTDAGHGVSLVPSRVDSMHVTAMRRELTPKSPTIPRLASLGNVLGPTDQQQQSSALSPSTRQLKLEPGIDPVPHLPTPPAAGPYASPAPTSAMSSPRHLCLPPLPDNAAAKTTPCASTSAPYRPSIKPSSLNHSLAHTQGQAYQTAYTPLSRAGSICVAGPLNMTQASFPTHTVPMTSMSQSGGQFQIMTVTNEHRTQYQLAVNTTSASKSADEKRKRNAGASARFRQRRKLREKASGTIIASLEKRLKYLEEDVVFYQKERKTLGDCLMQTPGGIRYFPRPASPRRNRRSREPFEISGDITETASGIESAGSYSGYSDPHNPAARMSREVSTA